MTDNAKSRIFVVDDDECILAVIAKYFESENLECTCFTDADICLQELRKNGCSLLITDLKMPGKDGLQLLTESKSIVPWLPVIVMTSYGDVPLAVKAVKTGAVDFIEKPLEWPDFLQLVQSTLKGADFAAYLKGKPLTKTEVFILRLILQGRSNKEIAGLMHRSVRTIEVHRSHIMHKLDVDNVVDLVKKASVMGFSQETQSEIR